MHLVVVFVPGAARSSQETGLVFSIRYIVRYIMSKQWWGFGEQPWSAFGFGYGSPRFFGSGEVRMAILSLLSEGPKHGYQLMKELTERSGGLYRASAGSVYPTLQQLEDEGLVRAEMQSGRRVYSLTEEGRRELASDPEGVHRIWERAGQCEDWGRPETIAIFPWVGALLQ